MTTIAEALAAKLAAKGMNQTDLARSSGLTKQSISLILGGQRIDPNVSTAVRLLGAAGFTAREIGTLLCQLYPPRPTE